MAQTPGEIVESVGRPIAGGANSLISGVTDGVRGVGSQLQDALDQPAHAVGLKSSPFKIVHHPINAVVGVVSGGLHSVVNGVASVAEGVTTGLDEVPNTLAGAMPKTPDFPKLRIKY